MKAKFIKLVRDEADGNTKFIRSLWVRENGSHFAVSSAHNVIMACVIASETMAFESDGDGKIEDWTAIACVRDPHIPHCQFVQQEMGLDVVEEFSLVVDVE